MEDLQFLWEEVSEPVFQLLAEGDFRHEIEDVLPLREGFLRQLEIDLCLAGTRYPVQQRRFSASEDGYDFRICLRLRVREPTFFPFLFRLIATRCDSAIVPSVVPEVQQ